MKLNSQIAVNHVLSEGITDLDSLADFDKESLNAPEKNCLQDIPKITANLEAGIEAETAVKGTCILHIDGQQHSTSFSLQCCRVLQVDKQDSKSCKYILYECADEVSS